MKAKAIVINGDSKAANLSEHGWVQLKRSSELVGNTFDIERFDAITPETLKGYLEPLEAKGIRWNYPFQGSEIDMHSGLTKNAYVGADPLVRISCFMSHYLLWKECAEQDEVYLILEHDAEFIRKLELDRIIANPRITRITGINDPYQATRRARHFHEWIQAQKKKRNGPGDYVLEVPRVDDPMIPQGIAGNSAYLMTPSAAQHMLDLVTVYGMWPNDAIMCYQLCGRTLTVTPDYYTRVQGLRSTTT